LIHYTGDFHTARRSSVVLEEQGRRGMAKEQPIGEHEIPGRIACTEFLFAKSQLMSGSGFWESIFFGHLG
jgi:hypothetical protein